ncbi:MAG: IS30 family transposase [Massilioclostridium sp.]|nr:IS30 family transposase [Massilioclostridium sp.]
MDHYHHLNTKERESILFMLGEGRSLRSIAAALGRSTSTISRELKRNRSKKEYSPSEAEKQYCLRRKKCCRKKLLSNPDAKQLVKRLFLEEQWSPEQISNRLKKEGNTIQASFATIYRAIYAGMLDERRLSHGERGVVRKLRHRGKTRHRKGTEETRGKLKISNSIEERPQQANDRSVLGHWEADTVAGKTGSSCMITLTDRKSRFLLLKKIQKKNSLLVRDGIVELLLQLPSDRVASITPDRGKEFSRHFEISKALNGLQFYFPNPHSPWQRGTNENTNGLIREYCPKSVDLETFHDSYFSAFTAKLNHRPRKCLDWKSPYEVFFGLVLHLT